MKKFLIVLLIFLSILPANADLILATDKVTQRYQPSIMQAYTALPERGKKVDVSLTVETNNQWLIENYDWAAGIYYTDVADYSHIELRETLGTCDYVFTHEFGHHVYQQTFTDVEKQSWVAFWKSHKNWMPRSYAKMNEFEGFSECYAMVYSKEKLLECKPLKRQVIDKIKGYFK